MAAFRMRACPEKRPGQIHEWPGNHLQWACQRRPATIERPPRWKAASKARPRQSVIPGLMTNCQWLEGRASRSNQSLDSRLLRSYIYFACWPDAASARLPQLDSKKRVLQKLLQTHGRTNASRREGVARSKTVSRS